jgi:CRISPR-associated exonuclease Cas4
VPTFSDLARAAYCPRQLHYARREDDRTVPEEVRERSTLAFRYAEFRAASDDELRAEPIARPPEEYRTALERLATRDDWTALSDPPKRRVLLDGKDCRGVVHKVLPGGVDAEAGGGSPREDAPPVPTLVSPGDPPERGVWEPQRVRAVAAAKALAWERGREVPRTLVEYPTHGVVRTVRLTTRNRAAYRRTLRTVESMDGPPARLKGSNKCESCEYRSECGVKTRSLRSLLGL